MIAKKFLFILALLANGMMFSLVSSHPLTKEEEQNLFKNPFTPIKEERQNPFQNFKNSFPSPSNDGDKNNFKTPFPFPGNDGKNPDFFKNPFPGYDGKNPFPGYDGKNTFPGYDGKNPFPGYDGKNPDFFKNPFPGYDGKDPDFFKNPFPGNDGKNPNEEPPYSMPGFNYWFTRYNPRGTATCDKFPRVCRGKGSPGPDCCKKRCVNVMIDNQNCGECGKRCRFGEMCCGGKCVNVLYDQKNCGACKNRCKKGSFCNFGMCSYA